MHPGRKPASALLLEQGIVWGLLLMLALPAWGKDQNGAALRTWKRVEELTPQELQRVDLRAQTPRHPQYPYLPSEPYPFSPPYTAEEMGYRAMEFTQRPRWSCVFANIFGSISSRGQLLVTGRAVGYMAYPSLLGVGAELERRPGEAIYRYLTQHLHPPEAHGSMNLVVRYRTDKEFTKKEDMFFYSPSLRRVRRQNSLRRGDRYPQMAATFDDSSGRAAWEFSWRLLGTDVLYETVRFPITRPRVLVTQADGSFRKVATRDLKLMGEDYPLYTPEEGVACYVVEARARKDWRPHYYAPRMIYWLDQHAFYPLRTEMYGTEGKLIEVEVRMTHKANPELGERGYSPFILVYWDLESDLLTYNIRDGIRGVRWSKKDELTFFRPDFMRRQWYLMPVKSYLGVERPEEFFLRPRLEEGKFPEHRPIEISPQLRARIEAQDRAGKLIFEETPAPTLAQKELYP